MIKGQLAVCWAELWRRRVELYVLADKLPPLLTRDEFRKFEEDWELLGKDVTGKLTSSNLIEAWQVECKHDLKFPSVGTPPEGNAPYLRYVKRLVARARILPVTSVTLQELNELFAASSGTWDVLKSPPRMMQAVEWAIKDVSTLCGQHTTSVLLTNPFTYGETDCATACFKLLQSVRQRINDHEVAAATVRKDKDIAGRSPDEQSVSAVFAEQHWNAGVAKTLTAKWIEGPDGAADHSPAALDGLPAELAWYAAVKCRLPAPTGSASSDNLALLRAATNLLQALKRSANDAPELIAKEDSVKAIYNGWLMEVEARARKLMTNPGKLRGDLRHFFLAGYDFLAAHETEAAPWPLDDKENTMKVAEWIDSMLQAAIDLSVQPSLPRGQSPVSAEIKNRLRNRAQRRLQRDDREHPDRVLLTGAIGDATAAAASDLLLNAYSRRAMTHPEPLALIDDLKQAVENGKIAIQEDKNKEDKYIRMLLCDAYIQRANYGNFDASGYSTEDKESDLRGCRSRRGSTAH